MIIPAWYRPILTLPSVDVIKKHQQAREKQYKQVFDQVFSDLEFVHGVLQGTCHVYKFTDETTVHDLDRIHMLHMTMVTNFSIMVVYAYNLCMSFYQDIPDELRFALCEYVQYAEKPEDQFLKDEYAQQCCFTFHEKEDKWVLSDTYKEMCEIVRKCLVELLQVLPTKIP